MMRVGIDLVEINRLEKTIEKYGNRFLKRCYTQRELEYCFSKVQPVLHLAGRFAAKEAVMKALGKGVGFKDVEVVNERNGRPKVIFNDQSENLNVELSISHTRNVAVAVVTLEEKG